MQHYGEEYGENIAGRKRQLTQHEALVEQAHRPDEP